MDKGLNSVIHETFQIEEHDIRTYSPLTLAYIGDGVYDLVVRSIVVGRGNTAPRKLHTRTSRVVNAHAQTQMMEVLEPVLTEEELSVYRRGRNAKSGTMAKNATMADYRKATGFEALVGYLYLCGQGERLMELLSLGLEKTQGGLLS